MIRLALILFILNLSSNLLAQDTTVIFQPVINEFLSLPIQITHAGDGSNRVFVVEKSGRIKVFNYNYILIDTLISISNMGSGNEQGLLSVAFHPDFKQNGYFYVFHTQASTNNLIVDRYTISGPDPDKADISTRLPILSIPHPAYTNHNGGEMHFGKDGYLYISTGDGGGGDDPDDNGQDSTSLLGKILRIDINFPAGGKNYSIPADNPKPTSEVFCYGLRNPFRWSFDRYNGDIYIGDVGQGAREEINYRALSQIKSSNFGWDCFEGSLPHATSTLCLNYENYVSPIYEYNRASNNRSVIGGNVYRGYAYPDLKGWYFAADYYSTFLRKINKTGSSWLVVMQQMPNTSFADMVDFGETEDGELHIVDMLSNIIYKITNASPKIVYTFTGNGNWMDAINWKGGNRPQDPLPPGAVIVIKPFNNGVCRLSENKTIAAGANFFIEPGCNFILENSARLIIE